jgi:sugar phosphate isomerase/epimerase
MKTSLFIGTEDMPELSYVYVFTDTVENNVARAAQLGFDGVELLVGDPAVFDPAGLESALKQTGIRLACINTGRMMSQLGLTLIHEQREVRDRAFEKLELLAALCGRLACALNIGLFRGQAIEGRPIRRTKDQFVGVLRDACDCASQYGAEINFEPTNRFETNFIHTTLEGLQIIEQVARPNLGLLLDTYHMYIEEVSLLESIRSAGDRLRHVHFSDSDRWPPGVSHGELDLGAIMAALEEIGYDGFLSVGLVRSANAEECARATAAYLKGLISGMIS